MDRSESEDERKKGNLTDAMGEASFFFLSSGGPWFLAVACVGVAGADSRILSAARLGHGLHQRISITTKRPAQKFGKWWNRKIFSSMSLFLEGPLENLQLQNGRRDDALGNLNERGPF